MQQATQTNIALFYVKVTEKVYITEDMDNVGRQVTCLLIPVYFYPEEKMAEYRRNLKSIGSRNTKNNRRTMAYCHMRRPAFSAAGRAA